MKSAFVQGEPTVGYGRDYVTIAADDAQTGARAMLVLTLQQAREAGCQMIEYSYAAKLLPEENAEEPVITGTALYGPGPTPCDPSIDNPEPPYDPFPEEGGEQA